MSRACHVGAFLCPSSQVLDFFDPQVKLITKEERHIQRVQMGAKGCLDRVPSKGFQVDGFAERYGVRTSSVVESRAELSISLGIDVLRLTPNLSESIGKPLIQL